MGRIILVGLTLESLGEGTFELRPEKEPVRERTPKECSMLKGKHVQRP